MLAWALLVLTLLGSGIAGFVGYEKVQALEAGHRSAQVALTEASSRCEKERLAASAQLEQLRAENQRLSQEQAELTAARDEALRAADETSSALEKVRTQKPSAPTRRRKR